MKNAILVRVGIDSGEKFGKKWNAPVNPDTGKFAYVPIIENEGKDDKDGIKKKPIRSGYEKTYEQFKKPCKNLGKELHREFLKKGIFAHLDPDFEYLTYGDGGNKSARLRRTLDLGEGDILAFYAGLKPPNFRPGGLVYALIGLYEVACVMYAKDIPKKLWRINAHTRREPQEDDIVVLGKAGKSGRLVKYISIGEYHRKGWYYLESTIQEKWGEPNKVSLQFGYLHSLYDPARFYEWFIKQSIPLVPRNNLD